MTGELKLAGLEVEGLSTTYRFAYESIRNGAPGLSDATCAAIARSINMKVSVAAEPAEARIRELEARVNHLTLGCAKQNDEVCQVLGRALGYPAFVDDQVNFPGATEADGVCVGDHVAESMADEAARRISAAEAKLARAVEGLEAINAHRIGRDPPNVWTGSDICRRIATETLAALQQEGE